MTTMIAPRTYIAWARGTPDGSESDSTASTIRNKKERNTYAPYTIITAAEDGVTIIWDQQQNQSKNTSRKEDHSKRQRLCTDQQLQQPSLGVGDYDTW
jgi:hypothetical protein